MLVPTKGIHPERALLTVGAVILSLLESPARVSGLWARFTQRLNANGDSSVVTFDWFTLALSMLFAVGVISWNEHDRLVKCNVSS